MLTIFFIAVIWNPTTNVETPLPDMPGQVVRVYPSIWCERDASIDACEQLFADHSLLRWKQHAGRLLGRLQLPSYQHLGLSRVERLPAYHARALGRKSATVPAGRRFFPEEDERWASSYCYPTERC